MENFAYLHLTVESSDPDFDDSQAWSFIENQTFGFDTSKWSSRAWQHLLPVALVLTIMASYGGSVMALERGDRGPSVRRLQEQLRNVGFYQAPITQVYDIRTENAVRRFQKAAGLEQNGVVGATTQGKLNNWRAPRANRVRDKVVPTTAAKPAAKPASPAVKRNANRSAPTPTATRTNTNNSNNSTFLRRGDEGERVRVLQERLRVAGFYYGNSTGIFGPITEEAVKRFQQAYSLTPDGVVGPRTEQNLPPIGVGYGEDVPPRRIRNRDALQLGDRGEAVRVLQEQLINAGYLEGKPNGYFGPYTADAVRRFQSANYLSASGVAGPTTRAKLYELLQTKNIKQGEFNVLEIQRRLRERGFYKGNLNGVMGDDTRKAIRQAQEFYGISLSDVRNGNF